MGSVHKEQVNEGRGTHESFDYTPLSDPIIVQRLIENRMMSDATYYYHAMPSMDDLSAGGAVFNESIFATYISLDAMIERAGLSRQQAFVVGKLMAGWRAQDIADEYGCRRQSVDIHLRRAVQKIVKTAEERWLECHAGRKC